MRMMQQSPALKHILKQSGIQKLPTRISSSSVPTTTDASVPVAHNTSTNLGTRCEACHSLSTEKLEVDYGHLSHRATTGVPHHNFDDLKKSAANGCDLCRVLVWAVYRTTHLDMRTLARNIDRISSSNERLYLRLTTAQLGYVLRPSLMLCIPISNSTTERQQDSGGINTIKWAKVAQANVYAEPPAPETGKTGSSLYLLSASSRISNDQLNSFDQRLSRLKGFVQSHPKLAGELQRKPPHMQGSISASQVQGLSQASYRCRHRRRG